MRRGVDRLCGGRLRRFCGSELFDLSAAMEQPRPDENCDERESSNDGEWKVIELRQRRQQGRPLELRLNEIVAGTGRCAFHRDSLGMNGRL